MLGHLFIELCFLADIALSELRLIIFSYLLRKILRTVSPDFCASLIWRITTANRCHTKDIVGCWHWLQCQARKGWSVARVQDHALYLRGLTGMHSKPRSWKLSFQPMLCMRHKYVQCTCLSPMHFCNYSFITFLSRRPPPSMPHLETGTEKEMSENQVNE